MRRGKVNGSLTYAIDVRLPDMLYATIAQCPVFGGKIKSVDEAKVKAMPGVRQVVRLDDSTVCVIADSFWQAKKALDALPVVWDEGRQRARSRARRSRSSSAPVSAATNAGVTNQIGDALAALEAAPRKVEAEYNTPFLDHANMEPMNCTAKVADGKVEVWVVLAERRGGAGGGGGGGRRPARERLRPQDASGRRARPARLLQRSDPVSRCWRPSARAAGRSSSSIRAKRTWATASTGRPRAS